MGVEEVQAGQGGEVPGHVEEGTGEGFLCLGRVGGWVECLLVRYFW